MASSLKAIARDFMTPKPRPNDSSGKSTKEIVNGLDDREYRYGWIATGLAIITGIVGFIAYHNSTNVKDHNDAVVVFAAFIVGWLCMVAGTALRRRALLGFASFLVGLEMLSYIGGVIGIIWLAFGFWLISRVMRKQRLDREEKQQRAKTSSKRAAPGPPKASKRYTPPRARSTSGRRR